MKSTQRPLNRQSAQAVQPQRRGVAAAECALVLPLLVGLVLGVIDVGQFVNVGQIVNNASREGARQASRDGVTKTRDVRTKVREVFAAAFPNVPKAQLNNAISITVFDSSGNQVAEEFETDADGNTVMNGNINVSSGNPIAVRVRFNYSAVRWARGFPSLGNQQLQKTTTMRRE